MRSNYPQPANEADFEGLGLDLLREKWGRPELQLYGRRGEEQNGIDALDVGGETPVWAAQFKLHEPGKSIPPREIKAEVEKAKTFDLPLGRYAILTTGKVSTHAQKAVQTINAEHAAKGWFTVELIAWDQIQVLLDRYPEVAQRWFGIPTNTDVAAINAQVGMIRRGMATKQEFAAVRVAIEAQTTTIQGDAVEAQLTEAAGLIERYNYQVARVLLNSVKGRRWDSLSNPQRYKLLVSLAGIDLAEGKFTEAGKRLLGATSYGAGEEKHAANEAVAYELLDDHPRAFEIATRARASFPGSGTLFAIWARNAPPSWSLDALENEVPSYLASDAGVGTALALRAARVKDDVKTEAWARRAVAAAPNDPGARLLLAQGLLNARWLRKERTIYGRVPRVHDRAKVEEARSIFTEAIRLAGERNNKGHHVDALLGRAIASEGLGQLDLAEDDFNDAIALMPDEVTSLSRFAMFLHAAGRYERAIHLRRKAVGLGDRDSAFFLAVALVARDGPGDRTEATRLFRHAAGDANSPQRGNALRAAVDCLTEDRKYEEAQALLGAPAAWERDAAVVATLRAKVCLAAGDADAADRLAEQASEGAGPHLSWEDRRELALLLTRLGRHGAALPLWQQVTSPGDGDTDTGYLIESAARAGRHDVILEAGEAARLAGLDDPYVWRQELAVLEMYDPEEAARILQRRIRARPDDGHSRLYLSHLGLVLGRSDLAGLEPGSLPAVGEVRPEDGFLAVSILRRSGLRADSQHYAYELLRLHPRHVDAHRALHVAALPWLLPGLTVEPPERAGIDTAVRYAERGDPTERWLVIEGGPDPNPLLHEYPPEHPTVRRLLGLKVGDEFVISAGHLQTRTAEVKEIRNKYLYRALESVEQWQVRFPEESGFEMVRFNELLSGDGGSRPDFSPIFTSLDRRRESVLRAEAAYKSLPLTVHVFAHRCLSATVFEAMDHLAWRSGLSLACCPGDPESLEKAAALIRDGATLVADVTSLQTLLMLGMEGLLRLWSPRVVVPQAVLQEIVAYVEMCGLKEHDGLVMARVEGSYTRAEIDPEERRKYKARYERLVVLIREACDVRDGRALARLAPERREELVGCVGRHGAEAVLLAARDGHVLWTDDHRSTLLAESGFDVRRVWTQAALQGLTAAHKISEGTLNEASAKLIAWDFSGTRFGPPTILHAGGLADWDVDRWPFRQALDLFASPAIQVGDLIPIAAATLELLHRNVDSPVSRDIVTVRLVERLAARPVGPVVVQRLIEIIPRYFRLNPVREMEVLATVRACLAVSRGLLRGA